MSYHTKETFNLRYRQKFSINLICLKSQ